MKISITGDLGSGKSHVAKLLCKRMNLSYRTTGEFQRRLAQEYGVDSLEFNRLASQDNTIDKRIDDYLISLSAIDEDMVIDSRLAWHFVQNTLKVYLEVHSEIGAERILDDKHRKGEPAYKNRESAIAGLRARKDSENRRFFEKYGVKCDDFSNYDIVINTSASSAEAVCDLVQRLTLAWKAKRTSPRFWISPRFVFPTEHVRSLARDEARSTKAAIAKDGFKEEYPIECIKDNEYYFILNGHRRASGALFEHLDFIPFCLVAVDGQKLQGNHTASEFVASSFHLSWCYDWEAVHGFEFVRYPQIVLADCEAVNVM